MSITCFIAALCNSSCDPGAPDDEKHSRPYDLIYVKVVNGKNFSEIIKTQEIEINSLSNELMEEILALAHFEEKDTQGLNSEGDSYFPNLSAHYLITFTCRNAITQNYVTLNIRMDSNKKIISEKNRSDAHMQEVEDYLIKIITIAENTCE